MAKQAIDREALYGVYNRSAERKAEREAKWVDKMRHKAFDLPVDDDVQITTTTNNVSGMNWRHVLAMAVGAGTIGLAANWLSKGPAPDFMAPPAPAVKPVEMNFKVRFRDQNDVPFDYIPYRKQSDGE